MLRSYSYLAIVPRGLEDEISSNLYTSAAAANQKQETTSTNDDVLKITLWNEKEDKETKNDASNDLSLFQQEKKKRRNKNNQSIITSNNSNDNKSSSEWFPPNCSVGTIYSSGRHISVGYYSKTSSITNKNDDDDDDDDDDVDDGGKSSITTTAISTAASDTRSSIMSSSSLSNRYASTWACSGQLTGTVFFQVETEKETISQQVIAPSRCFSSLLALISVQKDNHCLHATPVAGLPVTATTNEQKINIDDEEYDHKNNNHCCGVHYHHQNYTQHSLDDMTKEIVRHVASPNFSEQLTSAYQVWKDCTKITWKDRLSSSDYSGLQNRIRDNQLRCRLSCIRLEPMMIVQPTTTTTDKKSNNKSSSSKKQQKKRWSTKSNSKLFTYSRQELCQAIMASCGSELVPNFSREMENNVNNNHNDTHNIDDGRNRNTNNASNGIDTIDDDGDDEKASPKGKWVINLQHFDIEIVVFILPPDLRSESGKLAFGFSLCPHSFMQSTSFACGHIPPDVTTPCIGSGILSKGILRLRPTTSHILLQMADIKKSGVEVVVDNFAGIGTIPVEADQHQYYYDSSSGRRKNKQCCISIGGDLVLNNPKYTQVAGVYESISRGKEYNDNSKSNELHSAILVAWDAAHLPLRTSSADVVVSDLPFGQQCLSLHSLNQLLPLVFRECARILSPETGRMVLLCGSPKILNAIEELSDRYWEKPIPRVSPVNIGGILAWVIRLNRNELVFNNGSILEQNKILARKKAIMQKRDRVSRQRKSEAYEQLTKKRKRDSGA